MNPRLRPWQGRTLPLSYSRSYKAVYRTPQTPGNRGTITQSPCNGRMVDLSVGGIPMDHLFLLMVGVLLAGCLFVWSTVNSRRRRWGTVFGEVISSAARAEYVEGCPEGAPIFSVTVPLKYRYAVNGIEYERTTNLRSSVPAVGNRKLSAKGLAEVNFPAYSIGDRLVVRFDPEDPKDSLLEEELQLSGFLHTWFRRTRAVAR